MPKQEIRQSQRELSLARKIDVVDVMDVMQFARNCHRKTLLSFCCMLPCIALSASTANFLSPLFPLHSTPNNDADEKISDIGDREHFCFWHEMAWHGMASITWNS
jgi:hypothetical protein